MIFCIINNTLHTLSSADGTATKYGTADNTGVNNANWNALSFDGGVLYGINDTNNTLYTFDDTGQATVVTTISGISTFAAGAINNGDYYISDGSALYTLNTSTGVATRVGSATGFGVSEGNCRALCFVGNTLYMVGATQDALYTLNTSTGVGTRVGSAFRFGLNTSDAPQGLASDGINLWMALGSILYTLNTSTGVATRVGSAFRFGLNTNDAPLSLSFGEITGVVPIAELNGSFYALITEADLDDYLCVINNRNGEAIRVGNVDNFGLSFRAGFRGLASNGTKLWTIIDAPNRTHSDQLYEINPTTGVATRVGDAEVFDIRGFTNVNIYIEDLLWWNGSLWGLETSGFHKFNADTGVITNSFAWSNLQGRSIQAYSWSRNAEGSVNVFDPVWDFHKTTLAKGSSRGVLTNRRLTNSAISAIEGMTLDNRNILWGILTSVNYREGAALARLDADGGARRISRSIDFDIARPVSGAAINKPLKVHGFAFGPSSTIDASNTTIIPRPSSLITRNASDPQASALYICSENPLALFTINPSTGDAARVGNVSAFGADLEGIDCLASDGSTLWCVGYKGVREFTVEAASLYTLNATTGVATKVGESIFFGSYISRMTGLEWHNGKLYGVSSSPGTLYVINPSTGDATRVGSAYNFSVNESRPHSLASHLGHLYMAGADTKGLYRINIQTGIATRVSDYLIYSRDFSSLTDQHVSLASDGTNLFILRGHAGYVFGTLDTSSGVITAIEQGFSSGDVANLNANSMSFVKTFDRADLGGSEGSSDMDMDMGMGMGMGMGMSTDIVAPPIADSIRQIEGFEDYYEYFDVVHITTGGTKVTKASNVPMISQSSVQRIIVADGVASISSNDFDFLPVFTIPNAALNDKIVPTGETPNNASPEVAAFRTYGNKQVIITGARL